MIASLQVVIFFVFYIAIFAAEPVGADRPAPAAGDRVPAGGQADQDVLGRDPRRRHGRRRSASIPIPGEPHFPAFLALLAAVARDRLPGRREARGRRRTRAAADAAARPEPARPAAGDRARRRHRGGPARAGAARRSGRVRAPRPRRGARARRVRAARPRRPDVTIWARSSLKPLQAVAMLRAGLDVDGADARARLRQPQRRGRAPRRRPRAPRRGAGLGADDLRNTPDWPLDADAAWQWRADGHGTEPLTQNCSGKHAGMLATCVASGLVDRRTTSTRRTRCRWRSRDVVARAHRASPVEHATVDGCGAPLFSTTLLGLARSFAAPRAPATGSAGARRRARCPAHPWHVAGTGRDATRFMEAVPGLVAKDGADGVYAAGLPDGGAVAFKIVDGSSRPRPAVLAAALAVAGVDPGARRGRRADAGARATARPSARSSRPSAHEGRRPARHARVRDRRRRRRRRDRPARAGGAGRRDARRRARAGRADRPQDRRAAHPARRAVRRRRRRPGARRQPVHALRRHPQGPPAHLERRGARARRASRWSTPSSPPCAPAGSRWRPGCSAPTWRSSWSTTDR